MGIAGTTTSKLGASLAAGLLVLAACGDDSDADAAAGPVRTDADGSDAGEEPISPGCDGDGPAAGSTTESGAPGAPGTPGPDDDIDPSEPPAETSLDDLELSLTEIGQFDQPTAVVARPGDPDLFVAEKDGLVKRVIVEGDGAERSYAQADPPLLDLGDEVASEGYEQGLLDLEFSPGGERLYLSYTAHGDTDGGSSQVTTYTYDGDTLDEASRKEIFTEPQLTAEHNGGNIFFGPDGCLYLALGDGSPVGDAFEHGQDPGTLLGAILRIDPEGTVGSDEGYAVPEDNPFVDDDAARPEVWLYGVRNPWRNAFDPATGDLWVADVGQHEREEINLLPAAEGAGRGANLGWSEMEGSQPYEDGTNPDGALLPLFDYSNPDEGQSVTGGVVYRGGAIEELEGAYLFGDFGEPALRALTVDDSDVDETWLSVEVERLAAFSVDNDGEVYLVSLLGPIYRLDP